MLTRSPYENNYTGNSSANPYGSYSSNRLGGGAPTGMPRGMDLPTPTFGGGHGGGGQGDIWGAISNIFRGYMAGNQDFKNPADAAMPYLDQIQGQVSPYYKHYMDREDQFLPELKGQYESLMNDPTGLMNKIGEKFKSSPGYQYNVDQATGAANRAAAAGGMLGTPAEQASLAKTVHGLADQDYGSFLDRGMASYGQGLQGISGLNTQYQNRGFDSSNNMADMIGRILMNKANLAYSGQENMNQMQGGAQGAEGDFFSDAFKTLGPMAMSFL